MGSLGAVSNFGRVFRAWVSSGGTDAYLGLVQPAKLTQRECEIYDLATRGLTNRDIASALFIQESTVKSHMSRVLAKTGVRTRSALIAAAVQPARLEQSVRPTYRPLVLVSALALAFHSAFLLLGGPGFAFDSGGGSLHYWAMLACSVAVLFAAMRGGLSTVLAISSVQVAVVVVGMIVSWVRVPMQAPGTLFLVSPSGMIGGGGFAVLLILLALRARRVPLVPVTTW